MSEYLIAAMPGEEAPAARLAALIGASTAAIEVRAFPDGESLVTVPAPGARAAIYCSLDRPNGKVLPLLLAASALRDGGAREVTLVAPYLAYMRQDKAFHPGEAVSQRVVSRILSRAFDTTLTLEPHLHRTASLDMVFGAGKAVSVSAAPLLAKMIERHANDAERVIVAGPDEESAPWTEAVAKDVGAPWLVMKKRREGGRKVDMSLDSASDVSGMQVCLVDDIASSGATLATAAQILKRRGAASVSAFIVHALMRKDDLEKVRAAGAGGVYSTDSIQHQTNAIEIAPLMADALKRTRKA